METNIKYLDFKEGFLRVCEYVRLKEKDRIFNKSNYEDWNENNYYKILANLIDGYTFKSLVATEDLNGALHFNSLVLDVIQHALYRLNKGETITLEDGRKFSKEHSSAVYAYIESFQFNTIIIKPSLAKNIDYNRFNQF